MPIDPIVSRSLEDQPSPHHLDRSQLPSFRERARQEAIARRTKTPVARVEDRLIPTEGETQVLVRIYWPENSTAALPPIVVFYHGGGWATGCVETHDEASRNICSHVGAVVVSVDYRLAPENPYPAAVTDSFAALAWVADHASELQADPARIAVAGSSAGGNLAAVVAQLAREAGGPALQFQLLWYPATTHDFSLPSIAENADAPILTRGLMRLFAELYLGELLEADPKTLPFTAAPANGDLAGLPPAYIATAQYDPLRDDGAFYAELLSKAGVPVELHNAQTLVHGYINMAEIVPAAGTAFARSLDALKAVL
jgi:acetyl esterase/lipase